MAGLALGVVFGGCNQKKKTAATRSPVEVLDAVLEPTALAESLGKLGGVHVHATAMFRVEGTGKLSPDAKPVAPPAITTTTDLWLDKQGNFRIAETNDQDGGRDIVRVGSEVSVALRYGKAIRRPAQDAENARFLAEALGAPWAAWEVARRQVEVDAAGAGSYRLRVGGKSVPLPAEFPAPLGLRQWRDNLKLKTLEGQVEVDASSQAVRSFTCKLTFASTRDELPIAGEVVVAFAADAIGKTADVGLPDAEPLHTRQRTILEERALLGGLGAGKRVP
jgi:hypothetical protein